MEFTRKPPTLGSSKTKETININFDLPTLELYCQYILSTNVLIRAVNLSTMKKLFDLIDNKNFINDPDKYRRVEFIKRGLEARCDRKLRNPLLILQYINGGPTDEDLLDTSSYRELSNEEVNWINDSISETLKYSFMYTYNDKIYETYNKFKNADYKRKGEVVEEFENLVNDIRKDFRKIQNENYTEAEFSLEPVTFEETVTDIYSRETSSSRQLITGLKGLNSMLGGGLESGRVYLILGSAAGGKSFTLLDLILQVRKYNADYICKDKTKKPCIVLLTMENSVHETVTRMFSLITGERLKDVSLEEAFRKLKEEGELVISDDNPINIIFKYKPNLSCDVGYLDTITEELEDRGFEVMLMVQDHIKRIKAIYGSRDMRLDLGEIVNEFKAYAVAHDIPLVTCSHLNRDAAKILDEAKNSGKQDLGRLMGRAFVSESMLMIDNSDVGIIITKEYDKTGAEWMDFLLIRTRCESKLEYFAQPYEPRNPIKLIEDLLAPVPVYKVTLSDNSLPQNNLKSGYHQYIRVLDGGDKKGNNDDVIDDEDDDEEVNYYDETEVDEYGRAIGKPGDQKNIDDFLNSLTNSNKSSTHKNTNVSTVEEINNQYQYNPIPQPGMVNGFIPFGEMTRYGDFLPTMDDFKRWHSTYDYLLLQSKTRTMKSGIFLMDEDGTPIADGMGNILDNMIPMDLS